MTRLHAVDWHLGRTLDGRKRNREFEGFLSGLMETIDSESKGAS